MPALGAIVLFAGMLFWTKLRLVSDIPRSAYAVPKEKQPAPDIPAGVAEGHGTDAVPDAPLDPDEEAEESDDGVPPHRD
jgi:hypothetical protein